MKDEKKDMETTGFSEIKEDIIEKKDKDIVDIQKKVSHNKKKIYKELDGKLIFIKVGTETKHASEEEIEKVRKSWEEFLEKNNVDCLLYVGHHAIDIKVLP